MSDHNLRGTFHDRYAIASEMRDRRKKFPRLLECVICIAQYGDPKYFQPCEAGEFSVVDLRSGEKAWLEIPRGATSANLTALVESHFAAETRQIDHFLWVV